MSNNDWFERGEFPPVGAECEYYRSEHNDWKPCIVEFIGKRLIVMRGKSGSEFSRKIAKLKFRPIKTEREKAIDEITDVLKSNLDFVLGTLITDPRKVAEVVYDKYIKKADV